MDLSLSTHQALLAGRVVAGGATARADPVLVDALCGLGAPGNAVTDMAVVVEGLGRAERPAGWVQPVVAAATLARAAGDGGLLSAIRAGRAPATCVGDPAAAAPHRSPTVHAVASGAGWALTGTAPFVAGATGADVLLVLAATPRGSLVAAVEPTAPGVSIVPVPTTGGDDRGHVGFDAVPVGPGALLAQPGAPETWMDTVVAVCRVALAAEMAAMASAALDRAVARARRRHQFGTPIGSFQALSHRLVDAAIDVRTVSDAFFDAAGALDRADPTAWRSAAAAKALANEACGRVTATAHQVHGAAGIYADQPLHVWHGRVQALAADLGTTAALHALVADDLLTRAAHP